MTDIEPGLYHYRAPATVPDYTVIRIYRDLLGKQLLWMRIGSSIPRLMREMTGRLGPKVEPWRE
jgi:hypothetical protein